MTFKESSPFRQFTEAMQNPPPLAIEHTPADEDLPIFGVEITVPIETVLTVKFVGSSAPVQMPCLAGIPYIGQFQRVISSSETIDYVLVKGHPLKA